MKFAFIASEKAVYPVSVLCRVLGVSRSGFHYWQHRKPSARQIEDNRLRAEIAVAYRRGRKAYGSPRVYRELRAQGHRVSRKRVERLMRESGLRARSKRRFRKTTDSSHSSAVSPNLLGRDFSASAPNQVWVTDVTAIWTDEGWVFLAAILDLFARRIVGWAMSGNNDTQLACCALRRAVGSRRPSAGAVHHSDRGGPYASRDYRNLLDRVGLVQSMSRKGDCWDNAVAESFFATLKTEYVDHEKFRTREAAVRGVDDYIDNFYNVERRHSTLGYLSPLEYELRSHAAMRVA